MGTLLPVALREWDVMPSSSRTARKAAKWKPWTWLPMNQHVALSNARGASIELSRRRVERQAADIFVARLNKDRRPRRRILRP